MPPVTFYSVPPLGDVEKIAHVGGIHEPQADPRTHGELVAEVVVDDLARVEGGLTTISAGEPFVVRP